MKFKNFLKDKKVALVGPAKYMTNQKLGKEIDEHDVVVRLNRGYELVQDYYTDIGRKTDVLYSCLIERAGNAGKLDPESLKNKYGVEYIVAPPESDFSGISHSTVLHYLVDRDKIKDIKKLIPVRIVDHKFHTVLAKKVNCKPNTGFMAIYDLLLQQPSSLSIYGFSFYLDGFMEGCKSGIQGEEGKTENQFAEKCFVSKRHVQKNMWEFCKKTLLNNPQIILDPTLKNILQLETFSKEQFIKIIK